MINKCFQFVAKFLYSIAQATGMTYNEINIIVYYLIVPLTWTVMIDILIKSPITTAILLIVWIVIFIHYKDFRQWCDWAFQKSVDFLLWFKCIGWNYILSSVIICVLIPLLIYGVLIFTLIKYYPPQSVFMPLKTRNSTQP